MSASATAVSAGRHLLIPVTCWWPVLSLWAHSAPWTWSSVEARGSAVLWASVHLERRRVSPVCSSAPDSLCRRNLVVRDGSWCWYLSTNKTVSALEMYRFLPASLASLSTSQRRLEHSASLCLINLGQNAYNLTGERSKHTQNSSRTTWLVCANGAAVANTEYELLEWDW